MRLLPHTMAGQLILFLLSALIVTQLASFLVFTYERQKVVRQVRSEVIATRMATVVNLLKDLPAENRVRVLRRVSSKRVEIKLTSSPLVPAGAGSSEDKLLAQRLALRLGRKANEVRMTSQDDLDSRSDEDAVSWRNRLSAGLPKSHLRLRTSILLASGEWLNSDATVLTSGAGWIRPVLISMGLMGIAMIMIVVVVIRRLTRPLRRLSNAAESFGRGESVEAIPETGPQEIRKATQTFNRMSSRLSRFVQDRMQILAAISHDLRTPIASLRLQAELVEDAATRERIVETLSEMQRITEATLDLAREDAAREDTRSVNLARLVEAVCDDLRDLGSSIEVGPLAEVICSCRVVALRRALRNVLENAVTYGESALVSLRVSGSNAVITVEDRGPGISDDQLDHVFEPFIRREPSRAAETGGVGLGLAIARSIMRGHGGDIILSNRQPSGLKAELRLPLGRED
ncbi:MAG: ATP-binding protein [Pseudomonadota bacterium]